MREFTASQVADALGIQLGTLRVWAQRHYLPFVESEPGKWRKFSLIAVVKAAILRSLMAREIPGPRAAAILERIPAYVNWDALIGGCLDGSARFAWLVEARYEGRPELRVELVTTTTRHIDFADAEGLALELEDTWGENLAEQQALAIRARVSVYEVGADIHSALTRILAGIRG